MFRKIIRYLCLAAIIVAGLMSVIATGEISLGGGGTGTVSSGGASGSGR